MKSSEKVISSFCFYILLLGGLCINPVLAQNESFEFEENLPKIRAAFGMNGGLGYRQFSRKPFIQNGSKTVFRYVGKPQPDWDGNYWAMNDKGDVKQVFFKEIDADLNLRLTLFDKKEDGIFITSGFSFSRFSFAFEHSPYFYFKGHQLSKRIGDLETLALHSGLGGFLNSGHDRKTHVFGRVSASYYLGHTTGGFDTPVNDLYYRNMTENGTGFKVFSKNIEKNVMAVTLETGITFLPHPWEISVSAHLPLKRYVFTEKYIFYQNDKFYDENYISYGTFHATATIRVGFNFFKTFRKPPKGKAVKTGKVLDPIQPLVENEAAVANATSYDRATVGSPIRLKVFFELEQALLLRESFEPLDELVRWMQDNSSVVIRLEGHTDVVGDTKLNMTLSQRRVAAVQIYLTRKGIEAERIKLKGYGQSRPLKTDCPPPNYCPENRRVEMIILRR